MLYKVAAVGTVIGEAVKLISPIFWICPNISSWHGYSGGKCFTAELHKTGECERREKKNMYVVGSYCISEPIRLKRANASAKLHRFYIFYNFSTRTPLKGYPHLRIQRWHRVSGPPPLKNHKIYDFFKFAILVLIP